MSLYPAFVPLVALLFAPGEIRQVPPKPDDETHVVIDEQKERMTVPVEVAGAGPFRFIIDTGAERTVISRQLAGRLGLPAGRDINVVAMTGRTRVGTVIIPSLRMATVPEVGVIHAPALDAIDLGGMGLLGIDTLQRHKVTIDFERQTMAVSPSVRRERGERPAPGEVVVRAKTVFGQLIVTDAEVDGNKVRVVIDTGSPVSVGNHALRRIVMRRGGRLEPLEMTSATGGKLQTSYTYANRMRFGGVEFQGLPIAFADAPPFKYFGLDKKPAMLLGMSSLKFFRRVDIDFPNREVRFLLPRAEKMVIDCKVTMNGNCNA
ncbi:aspartyl protease family protein [Sphingomonas sp.]|uniref:aspartyl protease family protein n=1 Tax=Sphingomonas sp. TaxID=28214 RepID=UPI002DD618F3|nr:aspartyl protease family protein [Sphingomonas sp.]